MAAVAMSPATKCTMLVSVLLAFATHSAVTADDNKGQESTFNIVKGTKAMITYNDVIYMPPMMILGKRDGSIVRCPHETPNTCEVYHSGSSAVTATVVHGEFLFASTESGTILRCSWQRRHSCLVFHEVNYWITGLTVGTGFLYTGLSNGTVLRCNMNTAHNCHTFANVLSYITSLTASSSFVYVGVFDTFYRCDDSGNCSTVYDGEKFGTVRFGVVGDTVYRLISQEWLQCNGDPLCEYYIIPEHHAMTQFNGQFYLLKGSNEIHVNVPGLPLTNLFASHGGAVSISFSYGTYAMDNKYRSESKKCIWGGVIGCPPSVVYYEIQQRPSLEVFVKNGSLYDSQGVLVDTSDADENHSQKSAIFVMGPDGQILVSKVHKPGLLHTSSLLAGNPVAGAGLMVVEQGRIKTITACSVHYRPDSDLNAQIKESLRVKGYTDPIDLQLCTYRGKTCGQNDFNISENVY